MEDAMNSRYTVLLRDVQRHLGAKAAEQIDAWRGKLNEYASRVYGRDLSPAQRHEALEAVPQTMVEGLVRILETGVQKGTSQFDWLAENYGALLTFGAQGAARGFSYESRRANARSIIIEMIPRTVRKDEFTRAYEAAVRTGQMRTPQNSDFAFGRRELHKGKEFRTLFMYVDANQLV